MLIKALLFILIFLVLMLILNAFLPLSIFMNIASLAYACMCLGLLLRKFKKIHIPLMLSSILLDLGVLLVLEFQRGAIDTATSFQLGFLQQGHIWSSSFAVALYFPLTFFALMRLRKPGFVGLLAAQKHRRLGIAAFLFRSVGFILMFSLLDI